MTQENETVTAESLMGRLQAEANRSGDARRIGTLARLVEACDEIMSGDAYKRAKSAKLDPERFNPNFVKLNSQAIHQYVLLRDRLERGKSEWKGPVATTIRGEKDLMTYLKLRDEEAKRPGKPRMRGPRTRKLDELVDAIEGISDQALLRQALADGRAWKRELDILLATLRKLPEVDVDALREGRVLSNARNGQGGSALTPDDTQILRKLLARLRDNDALADFGLISRNGRVKMDIAPGLDLIYPEELGLLARLAGIAEIAG
ncbi:hypothetical protein GGQ99_002333 [Aminobacter niigataensis]|uniref:Uncharacterized protein n=1 Tax=Aminobacter niigataensis TaxID=83265 RepID=A0ABR6L1R2_9HYPH|nr:hypothetical protein [Aminobacter niigataensis]MBB4650578.1 hypothetical protein [Aminobacter niigataensis]